MESWRFRVKNRYSKMFAPKTKFNCLPKALKLKNSEMKIEHKICKLLKSPHGLKQTSKKWNEKFKQVMISNGYSRNGGDISYLENFKKITML